MTITAQTARSGPYSGNGSTTVFDYGFRVDADSHLVVTLQAADGTETVQILTTDYTVSGVGNANGGSVTMTVAPAVGEQLVITRAIPLTQEVDLQNRKAVDPETLELSFDKLTQIVQDLTETFGRTVKVDAFDGSTFVSVLPSKAERAGNYFAFDVDGNPIMTSGTSSAFIVSAFAETLLDDGDAATMLTTLGLTATAAEINVLDGITANVSEINVLDGITANVSEINVLDGITANVSELNLLDGVTWTLTDLNPITAAGIALLDDADAAAQRTTLGLGNIATTDLIDEDDMASNLDTRAPTQQSVKAYVDGRSNFIASVDASNSATIDFTQFDATQYDAYEFVLMNIIPSADPASLLLRTSSNGGSSYDDNPDYDFAGTYSGTNEDSILLAQSVGSSSGEHGWSGTVRVFGPHLSKKTEVKIDGSFYNSTGGFVNVNMSGARNDAGVVDAIRFLFSTGNIESGTITMYGLRNA